MLFVLLASVLVFGSVGEDVPLTLAGMAGQSGRLSAYADLGETVPATRYQWFCAVVFDRPPQPGQTVEISFKEEKVLPRVRHDRALLSEEFRALQPVATLMVPRDLPTQTLSGSGLLFLEKRYVAFGVWNNTSTGLAHHAQLQGCLLRRLE